MKTYTLIENINNINFKRGLDSKKSLGLGSFYGIPLDKMKCKDIMKKMGFIWDRETINPDDTKDDWNNTYDIWIKNDLEIVTDEDPASEKYSFWAWDLSNGKTIYINYEYLNHIQLLDEIKSEAKKEMKKDF